MKVDHFAIEVSDLAAAIRFYTEKLGLKLMFSEVDQIQHEAYAFLELEGGNLELLQGLTEDNQPKIYERPVLKPPYCPHLALQTDDIDSILALTKARGIPLVKGPLEIPGKVKWLYLSDPDNHVIEFVEWENPSV